MIPTKTIRILLKEVRFTDGFSIGGLARHEGRTIDDSCDNGAPCHGSTYVSHLFANENKVEEIAAYILAQCE